MHPVKPVLDLTSKIPANTLGQWFTLDPKDLVSRETSIRKIYALDVQVH
jgi:hypothetical protein